MTQAQLPLTIEHLGKWYGSHQVLRDVSLSLRAHERVVVCGPSGSGKSTLLRCINGLEPHQAGRIVVAGVELTRAHRTLDLVRQEVGMVFQSFNLFPHLTVLENCTLAPFWARHMSREQADITARGYLERVRLSGHLDRYPSQLSGGEQQRVAIARALCMRPKLMLFDEPTSALDPALRREVLDIIQELAQDGMTMICVTHEMEFAAQLADRVVVMDGGAIREEGPPDKTLSAYR